jgi:hypothetical protein
MLQIKFYLHYFNLISSKSLNFRQTKQGFGGAFINGTWTGILSHFADQVLFLKKKI